MKTPLGYLKFRLVISRHVWGEETELRTYRNKLLYYNGRMASIFDKEDLLFAPEKDYVRYRNDYFLSHAEYLTINTTKLHETLAPCLDWPTHDYAIISYGGSQQELFVWINGKSRFIPQVILIPQNLIHSLRPCNF